MSDTEDTKGKVLHFPTKTIKKESPLPALLGTVLNEAFDNMTPELRTEFSNYLNGDLELRFKLSDDQDSFVVQPVDHITWSQEDTEKFMEKIDFEEMDKMMNQCEDFRARSFEYIKAIEWEMFDAFNAMDHAVLLEITKDLQEIFKKIGKKG